MGSPFYSGVEVSVYEEIVEYYLSDLPDEDIVTFCHETMKTLEQFVTRVYSAFP